MMMDEVDGKDGSFEIHGKSTRAFDGGD